jgi:hypothetical protein
MVIQEMILTNSTTIFPSHLLNNYKESRRNDRFSLTISPPSVENAEHQK